MVVENACIDEIIIKSKKKRGTIFRYSILTLEKSKNGERRRVIIIIMQRMLVYLLLAILMYSSLA